MSRPSKNKQRRDRLRARQQVQRAARRDESRKLFWHGGAPGLPVGTVLVSRVEAARLGRDLAMYDRRNANDDPTRKDRVYLTTDRELARTFAASTCITDTDTGIVAQHGDLYQVEPIGSLEADPDNQTRVSWQTTQAKIVAVAERNVSLDQYEVTRRAGPHACWSDGSPIYNLDGSYRRSPEQRAARFDHPVFQHLPSWSPLAYINAWIAGRPDDDRPDPAKHPGIMMRARGAWNVLKHHGERARRLMDYEFRSAADKDIPAINRLFGGELVFGTDQERGAIVVVDRTGLIVAAMVFTAMLTDGVNLNLLIDRIQVAEHERHRGIASVLMLAVNLMLPQAPAFALGHCPRALAPFFAQMGYTVLHPGVPIFVPTSTELKQTQAAGLAGDDECWFYRQGQF